MPSTPQPPPKTAAASQERRLIPILLLVTFATGMIEAVSYFHLGHIFVAYVTGTILLFGAHLVGVGTESPMGSAFAISSFLVGAAVGGRLVRRNHEPVRLFADLLVGACLLVFAAALVTGFGNIAVSLLSRDAAIVLLGLAMGGQMSATRHLNVPDMLIPAATSIVHGLAHDSWFAGGSFQRWHRRVGVVLALLAGSAAGAGLAAIQPGIAVALAGALIALAVALAYRTPTAAKREPAAQADMAAERP